MSITLSNKSCLNTCIDTLLFFITLKLSLNVIIILYLLEFGGYILSRRKIMDRIISEKEVDTYKIKDLETIIKNNGHIDKKYLNIVLIMVEAL